VTDTGVVVAEGIGAGVVGVVGVVCLDGVEMATCSRGVAPA
jgi:hypothetical protein